MAGFVYKNLSLGYPEEIPGKEWTADCIFYLDEEFLSLKNLSVIPPSLETKSNFYSTSHIRSVTQHQEIWLTRIKKLKLDPDDFILEVGCGDAVLMRRLIESGFKVVGIDPNAPSYVSNGKTIQSFFNIELSKDLITKGIRPKVIIASHVIYQIPNHQDFLKCAGELLADEGALIFDSVYLPDILYKNRMDAFSHLTCHWPTVHSIKKYCEISGHIKLNHVEHEPNYRGGSITFFCFKNNIDSKKSVSEFIQNEKSLIDNRFIDAFVNRSLDIKKQITKTILELERAGYQIGGFGAGIKASTFVSWAELQSKLSFYIDNDPSKQGLYVANTSSRIISLDNFKSICTSKTAIINLSLDHTNEIEKVFAEMNALFIDPLKIDE